MEGNDSHRTVSIVRLCLSLHQDVIPIQMPRDRVADAIRAKLGLTAAQLTLAQVLESATWKGGREIAKQKRPLTGGPPIDIESDGTIF